MSSNLDTMPPKLLPISTDNWGEESTCDWTVGRWFKEFCSRDKILENEEGSRRACSLDNEQLLNQILVKVWEKCIRHLASILQQFHIIYRALEIRKNFKNQSLMSSMSSKNLGDLKFAEWFVCVTPIWPRVIVEQCGQRSFTKADLFLARKYACLQIDCRQNWLWGNSQTWDRYFTTISIFYRPFTYWLLFCKQLKILQLLKYVNSKFLL